MALFTIAWCFAALSAASGFACSAQLWNWESFSLCSLIGTIYSCPTLLSRPRTVLCWYGSIRCLQLMLSAWLEVVVIYPVRLWIYSVSSRDFSVCLSGEEI